MQIGSIIELVNDSWFNDLKKMSEEYNIVYPVKDKRYTIREIVPANGLIGICVRRNNKS